MAIDFPNGAAVNAEHSANGKTWIFDGTKWTIKTIDTTAALQELTDTTDSTLSNTFWMGV